MCRILSVTAEMKDDFLNIFFAFIENLMTWSFNITVTV